MASLIGQKLGQYEVIELLGQGGMATVYKAYQESIDRYVAIKVLPPHAALDDQFIERFQLEAKTIGGLQHPHILSLYDYGTQDDILYLVMAFVDGGSLEDIVKSGERLPVKDIEKILREIASALDYAHRRGIIHRDVKPANILLDSEGNALLADFGIVKMMGNDANLTGTGVVGTPAYISPEQGQGEINIDGRADLYSLACVVFELFSGYQPYRAETMMKVVLQHIADPVPNIIDVAPELPVEVSDVIAVAMAKDPNDRFDTVVEFAETMSRALHQSDASLAAIHAKMPLDKPASAAPETKIVPPLTMATSDTPKEVTDSNQTIIVQQTTNPILFMGVFGLIALVIVIVAIVLVGQQNQNAATASNFTQAADTVANATTETQPTGIPTAPPALNIPTFGELRYNTTDSLADTINLQVEDVKQPRSGNRYVAWLNNTVTEDVMNIGEIVVDASGRGILLYTDEESRMLAGLYNQILISEEPNADGDIPEGAVVYIGEVPIELTNALYQIFVSSPDGFGERGLLFSATDEASTAQNHAGLAAGARSIGSMQNHAEHTLNIINGTNEDYDGNGSPSNPGRGVGVFFFLDKIDELLLDVVQQDDATIHVQQNAEFILVCTTNVRDWANRVNELELELINADSIESVTEQAAESQSLVDAMINGIDLNENGQIEAFEGECGLNQIPDFGIQVGNVNLIIAES